MLRCIGPAVSGLAFLASISPAVAAPITSGLETLGQPVSDAELATQRGKFLSPGNISYFGIQMQTSWQGPDGITTGATLLFSVDFAGAAGAPGAASQLLVGYDRSDGDPSLDVSGAGPGYVAIALPAGLGSVQGAVQSQQIGGNDNRVSNAMRIAIVPASMVSSGAADGLTPASDGQTFTFADGDQLQVAAGNNRLGLTLTGSESESVRQGIDGNIGQLAQNVILSSHGNDVRNGMVLTIGTDPLAVQKTSVSSFMTSLRGFGF